MAAGGDGDDGYGEQVDLAAAELARLGSRLRGLSRAAWASRRSAVLAAIGRLVEIERLAAGGPPAAVPDIPDHALGDAVAVVGGDALDALAATPNADLLSRLTSVVRGALTATR